MVNKFLATKEASKYKLTKKYSCLQKQLKVDVRERERIDEDLVEIEATLKLIIIYLEEWKALTISDMKILQQVLDNTFTE